MGTSGWSERGWISTGDTRTELEQQPWVGGAAAVPENTVKVQAALQARHCLGKGQAGERCRNKPAAAGAGDSGERLLAYQDRPFEERRHSRRTSLCSSTAPAAATARGEKAGGDGVAVGGKWLKRRRIQLHRDFLDGRNLPVWRGDPSLPQSGKKGSCPKLLPVDAARQH